MPLISIAEYAASRKARGLIGGSRQAVHKAIKTGRIAMVDGKIDAAKADRAWSGNTSTVQQERGAGGGVRSSAEAVGATQGEAVEGEGERYIDARARKETAQADMAEIEAAKLRGEVASVEDFEKFWSDLAASFRARLMTLAPTVAPLVVGKTLPEAMEIIQAKVYEALSELSGNDRLRPH